MFQKTSFWVNIIRISYSTNEETSIFWKDCNLEVAFDKKQQSNMEVVV